MVVRTKLSKKRGKMPRGMNFSDQTPTTVSKGDGIGSSIRCKRVMVVKVYLELEM